VVGFTTDHTVSETFDALDANDPRPENNARGDMSTEVARYARAVPGPRPTRDRGWGRDTRRRQTSVRLLGELTDVLRVQRSRGLRGFAREGSEGLLPAGAM